MEAASCDRCKNFFSTPYEELSITINGYQRKGLGTRNIYANVEGGRPNFERIDLCPSCKKSFMVWWENPPDYSGH